MVFSGDDAYQSTDYLIKPYGHKNLTFRQKVFNNRFSRCRKSVECSFGSITQRYRIFLTPIGVYPSKCALLVKAACTLHNIIIDKEHVLEETPILPTRTTERTLTPKQLRDALAGYFISPIGEIPSQYEGLK